MPQIGEDIVQYIVRFWFPVTDVYSELQELQYVENAKEGYAYFGGLEIDEPFPRNLRAVGYVLLGESQGLACASAPRSCAERVNIATASVDDHP